MTLYERIRTWDMETLAEFLTTLLESAEDNLLESVNKHFHEGDGAMLVRLDHDVRVEMNIRFLMQEYDGTTV